MTNLEGIKASKNANSTQIEKITNGCKNQAWDLTYLTDWSTFYYNEDSGEYHDIFFFATADILLKRIFINTHNGGNLFSLVDATCSRSEATHLIDYYSKKVKNRKKPDFGPRPINYFQALVDDEVAALNDELYLEN